MTDKIALDIGIEITSVDDPGLRGLIAKGPKPFPDGNYYYFIKWFNGTSGWTPEFAFKLSDEPDLDPFSLVEKGTYGRLNDLRRNLTYIQMSGRLANIVYSMDTTNTEFLPYQYKPVLSFMESPSKGILIADEVGLGKTIEAGLIWTELRARYDARRLLVVCPAMLRDKWILELDTRFGIGCSQLNAKELTKELKKDKQTIHEGKGLICSLQGLRPPLDWRHTTSKNASVELARLLEDLTKSEPAIDLLVIDEAHYLRNPETQSAVIGRLLREVSEHIVLLSATPINNKADDLYQLLRLVDPDSFYRKEEFTDVLKANEPLICALTRARNTNMTGDQIKEKLREAQQHSLLKGNRQLQGLLDQKIDSEYLSDTANRVELANRIERINLLSHTINRTRKVDVDEFKVVREAVSHFVPLNPNSPEWQFYHDVTDAVREYASCHEISDGFLLSPPQRQMSSCMYAAARSWKEKTLSSDIDELIYEDYGEIETHAKGVGPLIEYIAHKVLPGLDIESLRQNDSKFERFHKIVTRYFSDHHNEKLIVFSYFKATLHYLDERLSELSIPSQVLHGSVAENKQAAIDQFRNSKTTRILLTSEIASEGVDMQFCSLLVNYDLPWNPMKIEQRIGRIDRIGQLADKVLIWNMGYADTVDERIYDRLLLKLGIFEKSLGGMEVILGKLISQLTSNLMSRNLTPEEEQSKIETTFLAAENIRQQQDKLEGEAVNLIAHGEHILRRVQTAYEFSRKTTEYDLKAFTKDYLDRYETGFEFQEDHQNPLLVSIKLPPNLANRLLEYIHSKRLDGKTKLFHGNLVRCQFLNKICRFNPKLEFINQFHPLIRFVSDDLKNRKEGFFPLVAVQTSRSTVPFVQAGVYAFVCKCWEFMGVRTDEVIQTRATTLGSDNCSLDGEKSWNLINAAKLNGEDWLSASNEVRIDQVKSALESCEMKLQTDYESTKLDRMNENKDRVDLQKLTLARHRDRLLDTQNELLKRYLLEGRQQLVPMTEGRIKAIKQRFALQLDQIETKGKMSSSESNICYGIIRIAA